MVVKSRCSAANISVFLLHSVKFQGIEILNRGFVRIGKCDLRIVLTYQGPHVPGWRGLGITRNT